MFMMPGCRARMGPNGRKQRGEDQAMLLVRRAHLEGDGVCNAISHAKLLGKAEGGAQVGCIEGRSPHYGLISIQMPVTS